MFCLPSFSSHFIKFVAFCIVNFLIFFLNTFQYSLHFLPRLEPALSSLFSTLHLFSTFFYSTFLLPTPFFSQPFPSLSSNAYFSSHHLSLSHLLFSPPPTLCIFHFPPYSFSYFHSFPLSYARLRFLCFHVLLPSSTILFIFHLSVFFPAFSLSSTLLFFHTPLPLHP